MRLALLVLAGLALASPAYAQVDSQEKEIVERYTTKPHERLAGFELVKFKSGNLWWRRKAGDDGLGKPTWIYYATQTESGKGTDPPFAVIVPPDPKAFGVDEAAMLNRSQRIGTTTVAEMIPGLAPPPSAPPAAPAPEPDDDPIGQFCRRYHLAREMVYGVIGLGSGLGGVVVALLLRRIFGR